MTSLEPVDIDPTDHDGLEDEKWDDNFMKDLEIRFNKLREFNRDLNESIDDNHIEMTEKVKDVLKKDTIELVANQIYDRLTIMFNNTRERFGIENGTPIEPLRKYNNFKLNDDGSLTFVYKSKSRRTVIDLGNINNRIKPPSELRRLSVAKLKMMGFTDITDEDTHPYRTKYKVAREKVRKLNENLDERSKAMESPSTTDAEAIEMIEGLLKI